MARIFVPRTGLYLGHYQTHIQAESPTVRKKTTIAACDKKRD